MVKVKFDLVGQTFGKWKVLSQTDDYIDNHGKHYARWLCECQCDKHTVRKVIGKDLKSGKSSSCGCQQIIVVQRIGKDNKKYNTYNLSGEFGIGYTSKGEEFCFDLEDYDKIKNYCWYINNDGYVSSNTFNTSKRKTVLMHNIIKQTELFVDHKNHKKFDNRKLNLRNVTNSQNCMNHKLKNNNTSGVTGVNWDKKSKKWHSRIGVNNQEISLGFYEDFDTAVQIRKQAENFYHGKYSYNNSIGERQMDKQVFIINGSGGVGKDTFVSLVSLNFKSQYFSPIMNFSSVDKVKEIAKKIGWDGKSKTEKDRKFLSDLKLLCTEYNDMPFNSMCEKVKEFNDDKYYAMLFLHIREPEEIEKAKKAFNAKTILVKRNSVKHITSNMADENVFNYNYDIIINNDETIEELNTKALEFVKDFVKEEIKKEY